MKSILLAALLLGFASSARATETGYYEFSFTPDDPASKSFLICFLVLNDGAKKPFLELGYALAQTLGPYGDPNGGYDIVDPQSLVIFLNTNSADEMPTYQYFLTGAVDNGNIVYTRHARYTISLAAEPQPPRRGSALAGPRPGGYTIVDTGSFSVSFIGTQSCS